MPLHPVDDAGVKTRRNPAAQCRFAAFSAQVPGGVAAQDAANNCGNRREPGICLVGDEQKQNQVSGSGNRKRDDGGIDDRD